MKYLITIGRSSGSGGRRIGIALAKELGIPCYDEELVKEVAKNSGFSEEIISHYEEKPVKSFLYALYSGTIAGHTGSINLPISRKSFLRSTIRSRIWLRRKARYSSDGARNTHWSMRRT